jgi:hypothetical protein
MRTVAALTVVMTLAAACSTTWDIDRYEAPEADFPTRHTYAWKAGEFSTPVEQPAANVAEVDRAVRAAWSRSSPARAMRSRRIRRPPTCW